MSDQKRCQAPDCENDFTPRRSTKAYCTATCQKRAARARKAAEHNATENAKAGGKAEHDLVRAARKELEVAGALDTVPGQLALQLARRIADPECSGISAMSKEMRALLAEAKASGTRPAPPPGKQPEAPKPAADDEVTAAREARERKLAAARQAADRT